MKNNQKQAAKLPEEFTRPITKREAAETWQRFEETVKRVLSVKPDKQASKKK